MRLHLKINQVRIAVSVFAVILKYTASERKKNAVASGNYKGAPQGMIADQQTFHQGFHPVRSLLEKT